MGGPVNKAAYVYRYRLCSDRGSGRRCWHRYLQLRHQLHGCRLRRLHRSAVDHHLRRRCRQEVLQPGGSRRRCRQPHPWLHPHHRGRHSVHDQEHLARHAHHDARFLYRFDPDHYVQRSRSGAPRWLPGPARCRERSAVGPRYPHRRRGRWHPVRGLQEVRLREEPEGRSCSQAG